MESMTEKNTSKSKKRKFTIEDVISMNPSKVEPVLARFTNGCVAKGSKLTGSIYGPEETTIKSRKKRRILVVNGEKFNYVGRSYMKDSIMDEITEDYYLGILDENTKQMKLVEMSAITTQPFLHGAVPTKLSLDLEKENDEMSYSDKRERVVEGFGGKRAKQAVKRYKQFKVDDEKMSDAMSRAVNVAEINEESMAENHNYFLDLLPYCNREAKSPGEVYNLMDILYRDTLDSLTELAKEVLEEDTTGIKTPLFKQLITSARLERDEEKQLTSAIIALFVNYLIEFMKLDRKTISSKSCLEQVPQVCRSFIFKTFTQGYGRERTKTKNLEDKTLCYIFILSFIANHYELSKNTIVYSIKIQDQKLKMLMNYIGASCSSDGMIFKIKTPIPPIYTPLLKKKK